MKKQTIRFICLLRDKHLFYYKVRNISLLEFINKRIFASNS